MGAGCVSRNGNGIEETRTTYELKKKKKKRKEEEREDEKERGEEEGEEEEEEEEGALLDAHLARCKTTPAARRAAPKSAAGGDTRLARRFASSIAHLHIAQPLR